MIPLKIETLLKGRVVEHDRVEYKTGWNPNDIIHSICAFANDYDNTNGGYIVIGVKEENGMPVFPLEGVPKEDLDSIQQEIFQYCNQIVPRYIPRMEIIDYQNSGIFLIYLWCSAGDSGPYQAPKTVYLEIDNIRRGYLEDFIKKSNSSLIEEINNSTLEELLLAEEVADETDTELDIRNIGVLMFAEHPEKFIPGSYIELIRFNSKKAEASDDFIEKTFTGPIWKQVQDALDYINTNVIEEKVVKLQGQAESERFFHKSYREQEPVEIRIYVDSIQILNYPGLAKWINLERFAEGRIKGRKYRNRRIGELFKEIDLSEKKGTGIPKILRELKKNGSPGPEFDMDDDRTYLNTIIHIRDGFDKKEIMSESMSKSMSESMSELEIARIQVILQYLTVHDTINSAKAAELLDVEKKTASRLLSKAEKVEVLISKGKTKDKVYMKK